MRELLAFVRELLAAGWYVDCRRNTRGDNGGVWRGRWVSRPGACIYLNRHGDGSGYEIQASWWYGMRSLERAGSLDEVRELWLEIEADMVRGGRAELPPPAPAPEFEGQLDLFDALAGVAS